MHSTSLRLLLCWGLALALTATPTAAQDAPAGVFVSTPDGPQELGVYGGRTRGGRLRLEAGTLDEVHAVGGELRVLVNLPHFRLDAIWLSTKRVLDDDRAERRMLRVSTRRLSYWGLVAVVEETRDPARLARLLTAVGASATNPAYVFITLRSQGMVRDYLVEVRLDE